MDAKNCALSLIFVSIVSVVCRNAIHEKVLIKHGTDVKNFYLPTSDKPAVVWMDIQRGVYPNTTYIHSTLEVGDPITIFVYLKDTSNLYDLMVDDCWAYDNENFEKSKNKVHLNEEHSSKRSKMIDKWFKKEMNETNLKSFVYTNLPSFKFPDSEHVFIKCDIQLCFKQCKVEKS